MKMEPLVIVVRQAIAKRPAAQIAGEANVALKLVLAKVLPVWSQPTQKSVRIFWPHLRPIEI